jgi:hypothetical protein
MGVRERAVTFETVGWSGMGGGVVVAFAGVAEVGVGGSK